MKIKPILLYTLFFISVFFLFLFLLFPQREVAASLSRILSNSNVTLSIDKVKPGIPFKLYFENTKLLIDQTTEIVPESFVVFLGPTFIFNAEKLIKFQSAFYQGSLKGSLRLNRTDPFLFSQAKLFISGVKIDDFRYKTDSADIQLGCELSGEYKQMETPDKKDSGYGMISIRNFSAIMKNSLFKTLNLRSVDFSDIKLEFKQSRQRVTIKQCIAKGSIINVKLKGNIDIISPIQKTRLRLTGTILQDSPYLAKFVNAASIGAVVKNRSKKGIVFNIKGTLENPKIRI